MKYKIDDTDNGIDIKINNINDEQTALLEALQDCQQGRCSCPTDEYKKLESLDIEQSEDGIQLRLKSKAGTQLDKNEINRCLDHTAEQLQTSKIDKTNH